MDPGAIFLCNMTDYHKYYSFLITPECQHSGSGKLQDVQPWLQRQHPWNKLFSVICHRKEIPLPTPSCCLLDGRWSCEPVGCCCQLLTATLRSPLPLCSCYSTNINTYCGTKQNNKTVAEVEISLQGEDAAGFVKRVLGKRMWALPSLFPWFLGC